MRRTGEHIHIRAGVSLWLEADRGYEADRWENRAVLEREIGGITQPSETHLARKFSYLPELRISEEKNPDINTNQEHFSVHLR